MTERRPSRPPVFQPRFTLGLFYLAGFFMLYCLVFVAPALWHVLQSVPAGPDQERIASEAARVAVAPRLPIALLASLVTTGAGAWAGWLPGLRPPH